MQAQLTELQLKLAKEEEEKTSVTKLNQDLKQVIDYSLLFLSSECGYFSLFFSSFDPFDWIITNFPPPRNNPLPCIIARWVLNVSDRIKQLHVSSNFN